MSVDTKHPSYSKNEQDWQDIQAALGGERKIKQDGIMYLPYTSGMLEAAKAGIDPKYSLYTGYKLRAQYPEWVRDSIRNMVGLVSRLQSSIELKHKALEPLIEQATDDGFGLDELFIRSCKAGVEFGRYGLLADFDAQGKPYIAKYDALSIVNWKLGAVGGRRDLTLVVLQENHLKGDDEFSHETEVRYRVLDLDESGFYRVRIFSNTELIETIEPSMGSKRVPFIPFVFGGSVNNSHEPNEIPLLTMARCALKSYQLSADYFQSLYMTAHPQPYTIGVEPAEIWDENLGKNVPDPKGDLRITGVSSVWSLPTGSDVGYLEVSGSGIELTKAEMESQRNQAVEAGAKVIDVGGTESGEARKARQDDQHASMHTIVQSAANAIEQVIKYLALWLNLSDEGIEYSVPLEFSKEINPQMLTALSNLMISGKLSNNSLWTYMQTGKLPERSFDDEMLEIEKESMTLPLNRQVMNEE